MRTCYSLKQKRSENFVGIVSYCANVFLDKKRLRQRDLDSSNRIWTHKQKMAWVDIHVQAAGLKISFHNMCGQQRNSPVAYPIFGSKYGSQNGVQNCTTFSVFPFGLCLGSVLESRFGPKSGSAVGEFCCCPQRIGTQISDALAWAQVLVHAFFSVVLNTFLGPVLGAIMRQVCCHSPCHCFLMLALRRPSLKAPPQPSHYEALYSWWTWPTKPSGLQTPKLCSHHRAVDVVGLFVCTIILEI